MSEFVESVDVEIKVNGKSYQRSIEPRMLLVEFLREELGLTGRLVFRRWVLARHAHP